MAMIDQNCCNTSAYFLTIPPVRNDQCKSHLKNWERGYSAVDIRK